MAVLQSRFLDLPTEIRLYIFDCFFVTSRPPQTSKELHLKHARSVRVRISPYKQMIGGKGVDRRHYDWFGSEEMTRLFRVNKLVYAEASALLYSTFTFEFIGPNVMPLYLQPVLSKIGARQRGMIRSMRTLLVVTGPLPPGQEEGLGLLRELLPNLTRVELLPVIDLFRRKPSEMGPAEQTMKLFEMFSSSQLWTVHHPKQFKREAQSGVIRYVLMSPTERDTLEEQLHERHKRKRTCFHSSAESLSVNNQQG